MILFPLMECCEQLAIDPKTLRHWLQQAAMSLHVHPMDGRRKCLTHEQVQQLAVLHDRVLKPGEARPIASLVEPPPRNTQQEPLYPHMISDATLGKIPSAVLLEEGDLSQKLSHLQALVVAQQQQLVLLTQALLQERDMRMQHGLSSLDASAHPMAEPESCFSRSENPTTSLPIQQAVGRPLHPAEQRARFLVLPPLIEYGATGTYVVISSRGVGKFLSSPIQLSGSSGSGRSLPSAFGESLVTLELAVGTIVAQHAPGTLIAPSISMSTGTIWA